MTLTLTLREAPAAPLDVPALGPDALASLTLAQIERLPVRHGNRAESLGTFFAVSGSPGGDVRVDGDLRRIAGIGAGMTGGRLTVSGRAGRAVGAGMAGGELRVDGDAGSWAGAAMHGGLLEISGDAGDHLGAALTGERRGMTGGEIIVRGGAGDGAGAGLRRGLIAVAGDLGAGAGTRMLAGTIVALGDLGEHAGAGMRRGTIVAMRAPRLLPTFARACVYQPPFLALVLRRLLALGLPVAADQLAGHYARWSGDALELRRGEILILEPRT